MQRQCDALDRLALVSFGSESSITYTYDAANRKTKAVDSVGGEIDYEYDGLGRLTKETSPLGSVTYSYDKAGRRLAATASGQGPIEYAYNDANRLQEIRYTGQAVRFTYDDANRRTQVALRNGVTMDYAYDAAGQLAGITYRNGAGSLGDLTYSYDGAGRVIHVGGSLAKVNLPSAMSGAVYNTSNQLTSWNGASRSYDLNGSLVSDGTRTFTWNARGVLTAIASGGSTVGQFGYDAHGRRIRKSVNGAATQFVYDGANALQELSDGASPSLQASLLSGFGLDETYGRTNADGTTTEYLTDRLGSTLSLSDASGGLATSYAYEPYGAMSWSGAASSNSRTFTGREDDGTGLMYYRARYYDPANGRFISEDPIGIAGGPNLHVYVLADPINLTDPTGLASTGLHWGFVCNPTGEPVVVIGGTTAGCWKKWTIPPYSCSMSSGNPFENGDVDAVNIGGETIKIYTTFGSWINLPGWLRPASYAGFAGWVMRGFGMDPIVPNSAFGEECPCE